MDTLLNLLQSLPKFWTFPYKPHSQLLHKNMSLTEKVDRHLTGKTLIFGGTFSF